jgi:ribosome biogenesis protein Nip4
MMRLMNKDEVKYYIIHCGEDIHKSIVFDITDKLKEQGHYFVVNYTSNLNQFDVSRVSREEFNKFNGYEQDQQR